MTKKTITGEEAKKAVEKGEAPSQKKEKGKKTTGTPSDVVEMSIGYKLFKLYGFMDSKPNSVMMRDAIRKSMPKTKIDLLDVKIEEIEDLISGHSKTREGETRDEMKRRSRIRKCANKHRDWLRQMEVLPSIKELQNRRITNS